MGVMEGMEGKCACNQEGGERGGRGRRGEMEEKKMTGEKDDRVDSRGPEIPPLTPKPLQSETCTQRRCLVLTPHAHTSAAKPEKSPSTHASGAVKAGVPALLLIMSVPSTICPVPKSANLTVLLPVRRRFSGLMSRWMTPTLRRGTSRECYEGRVGGMGGGRTRACNEQPQ